MIAKLTKTKMVTLLNVQKKTDYVMGTETGYLVSEHTTQIMMLLTVMTLDTVVLV